MFMGAEAFDRPLNQWEVGSVTTMLSMFDGAVRFNQSLINWDVSRVHNMSYMFRRAKSFDADHANELNVWPVQTSIVMGGMFNES